MTTELTELSLPNGVRVVAPIRSSADVRFLYAEIFAERSYEQEGVSLEDCDVVVDVGANLGLFTLRVFEAAPRARVLCFEPSPLTAGCLLRNVGSRAECFQVALADRVGTLELTYFPRSPGNTTAHPELKLDEARSFADGATIAWLWRFDKLAASVIAVLYPLRRLLLRKAFAWVYQGGEGFCAAATTLDRVIYEQKLQSIDLLKVDVEGAEREVLAGMSDANLRRVRQLVMEIAPSIKGAFIPRLEERLRRSGFTHVALRSIFVGSDPRTDSLPCTLYAHRGASAIK